MQGAHRFTRLVSTPLTLIVLCAMLAATVGWQFVPSPPRQRSLQQQIDAMPRANGTGMHHVSEGGVISLSAGNDPRQRVIHIDKPIRLWSCVSLDGGGAKIVYTGPADRAAIELASYREDGGYFGAQSSATISNLHIVSKGKGIGFDPSVKGNAEFLTIRDVSITAERDAIDLRPPAGGFCYDVKLDNITVYTPGAAALLLHANAATIDTFRVRYGTRDGFSVQRTPAYVVVRGIDGGGGTIKDLHVEAYGKREESVTQLIVEGVDGRYGGTWTMIQGHLEQPGPNPAVIVRGQNTSLTYINPGIYKPVPLLATGGSRIQLSGPNHFDPAMLLHDAKSTIMVNQVKMGTQVAVDRQLRSSP